jgi:cell division protein FtsZ
MLGMGHAMMGTATTSGENAVVEAARQAIACPLLERGGLAGARGILINITGSGGLGLHEVNEACSLIREAAQNDDAQINFGVVMNESMGDSVKVTVIATGFDMPEWEAASRAAMAAPQALEPEPAQAPPEPVAAAPGPEPAPAAPEDDLDTPAFLRRERRLFR